MKAPIQIRREDVAADIRALAELMKVSITEAVSAAVTEKLEEERQKAAAEKAERWKRVDELIAELQKLPRVGPMLTDDDLYDEYGLPK
ncbi:MAG: hypothetical protein FJW36_01625 [Acidobacteria bacterium]|nr:hypothetical protein [Acidobacteriota bacterium]